MANTPLSIGGVGFIAQQPFAADLLKNISGSYNFDDLKSLGLLDSNGVLKSSLDNSNQSIADLFLKAGVAGARTPYNANPTINPTGEAGGGISLIQKAATPTQQMLASLQPTGTADPSRPNGLFYTPNQFKGTTFSFFENNFKDRATATPEDWQRIAQNYYEQQLPLPNSKNENGQYVYDPNIAPNSYDLLLNPGLKQQQDAAAQQKQTMEYLSKIFGMNQPQGGDNMAASTGGLIPTTTTGSAPMIVGAGTGTIPSTNATATSNDQFMQYLSMLLGQSGTGQPAPTAAVSGTTPPAANSLDLAKAAAMGATVPTNLPANFATPSAALKDVYGQTDPMYQELLKTIMAPNPTADYEAQIQNELLGQQQQGIQEQLKQDIATTKLDMAKRGIGGVGRTSDIEQNAIAQLRSGAARTQAQLGAESTLKRLEQIDQTNAANKAALVQAQSGRIGQLTELMKQGVLSDSQIQQFLLGELNSNAQNAAQMAFTGNENAMNRAAASTENAADRAQQANLAFADLLGKSYLQTQELGSKAALQESEQQFKLQLAQLEDQYQQAAAIADRNIKLQIAQMDAASKQAALDAASSWSGFLKTALQTGVDAYTGGVGKKLAAA